MTHRLLISLSLALPLAGRPSAGDYRVDLVVFAYDPPQTRELPIPLDAAAREAVSLEVPGFPEVPLSASMAGIAKKLRHSHGYRVLAALAWIQPALGPTRARAQRIRGQDATLDGTITLVSRHYLHLTTDLLFTPSASPASDADPVIAPSAQTYRIQGRRRMRLGEIHYLDHPQVGVLVAVNRAD